MTSRNTTAAAAGMPKHATVSVRSLPADGKSSESKVSARSVFLASVFIKDALSARVCAHLQHERGRTKAAVEIYTFLFSSVLWKWFVLILAWIHMFMVFFEPPATTLPLLPHPTTQLLELFILGVHALHLYLRHLAGEVRSSTIRRTGCIIALCALDTAYSVFVPDHFRFARLFRPYFFMRLSRLLKVCPGCCCCCFAWC
jgi:hypothetical protein